MQTQGKLARAIEIVKQQVAAANVLHEQSVKDHLALVAKVTDPVKHARDYIAGLKKLGGITGIINIQVQLDILDKLEGFLEEFERDSAPTKEVIYEFYAGNDSDYPTVPTPEAPLDENKLTGVTGGLVKVLRMTETPIVWQTGTVGCKIRFAISAS